MSATTDSSARKVDYVELFDGEKFVGISKVADDGTWSLPVIGLSHVPHVFIAKTAEGRIISEPWTITTGLPLNLGSDHTQRILDFWIARGKPPVGAKANGRFLREATGGVPPYLYTSSNLNVAMVDATTGEVTAAGNGTAVITVKDAANSVAQYKLTLTGIHEVRHLNEVWWAPSGPNREWVKTALTRNEMRSLYRTYSETESGNVVKFLGWPDKSYWTSDNIEVVANAYAFTLNTDAREVVMNGGTKLPTVVKV